MAKGAGQGQGGGEGHGETTREDGAWGSRVAICCAAIMCTCGISVVIGGAVLIQMRKTYVIRSAFNIIDLLII